MQPILSHNLPIATLALTMAAAVTLSAQSSDPLVTDRPDQTESAITVSPGKVQLEAGGTIELDTLEEGRQRDQVVISAPAVLVRIGLLERLEARVGTAWVRRSYEVVDPNASGPQRIGTNGMSVQVGGKLSLSNDSKAGFSGALIGGVNFPVAGDLQPLSAEIRGAVAQEFGSIFSAGLNLGGTWEEGGHGGMFYTMVAGISLSESFGTFVEVYGDMPWQEGAAQSFDTGLTWAPGDSFQLDIAAGFGLNREAADAMVGVGFSWRLPE